MIYIKVYLEVENWAGTGLKEKKLMESESIKK